MKYIAYNSATGDIKYFYESPVKIKEAPENLALLEINEEFRGSVTDTHKVVDNQLVLK